MKKVALLVVSLLFAIFLAWTIAGCKTVTAPLPVNALTPTDATTDATLTAATAAVNQYEADVKAGVVPAPVVQDSLA